MPYFFSYIVPGTIHLDGETEIFGERKFVQVSNGGDGGFSRDEGFGQLVGIR